MGINPEIGWQIIVVLSVILGILVSVAQLKTPLNELNKSVGNLSKQMIRLSTLLDRLGEDVHNNENRNAIEHKEMQGDIENHEIRITVLEKGQRKKGA